MLNPERVYQLLIHCLFNENEVGSDGEPKVPYLAAEGIMQNFVFHEKRYREIEKELVTLLEELQPGFFEPSGMTFLAMPTDKEGQQWGEHESCEMLLVLAIAGGYAKYLLPRDLWENLLGGMPLIRFFLPSTPSSEKRDG